MPRTITFDNLSDFIQHNKPLIEQNPFMYFNLERTIERVLNREVSLIKFFNIVQGDSQICVLFVKDECLIYSFDFDEALIPDLAHALEFVKFNRYTFLGMKDVIDSLFERHHVQYSEQKHRIYYSCSNLNVDFGLSIGELQMAHTNQLYDLIELSNRFAEEFYEGQKPFSNSKLAMIDGIRKQNLFQWIVDNKVVGIAQTQYDQFKIPVIGFVYTHPEYRRIGVGSSIAFKLTEGLLNHGHKSVRLMTDAKNLASNRAFQKVGYKKDGDYVVRYKEK